MLMIEAKGFHQANVMILEISYPGSEKKEFQTIKGNTKEERMSLGWQVIYRLNKNRVSETLCRWLKQRMFGLREYSPAKSEEAAKLLVLLHYHHQFDYFKLCRLIASNRAAIESIAPPISVSGHYKYYVNTIRAILDECEIMKNQVL